MAEATTTCGPPWACYGCGRRHRTWHTLARCVWPRACWVTGNGAWAVLAHCGVLTVTLWPTREQAERAKAMIDRTACGGRCCRRHEIVNLDDDPVPV